MEHKKIKYLNYAYNTAIILGGLVLLSIIFITLFRAFHPNIYSNAGLSFTSQNLITSTVSYGLMLVTGLIVKKQKHDLQKTKRNLIVLSILCAILAFLMKAGLLVILVFLLSVFALQNTLKIIKQKSPREENISK